MAVVDLRTTAPRARRRRSANEQYRTVGGLRGQWLVVLTVVIVALLWLVPTIGILVTSFRDPTQVTRSGWWTALAAIGEAGQWTLDNYREVLVGEGFGVAFLNSLAVAVPATVIPLVIGLFGAYALTWMPLRGRALFRALMVGLLVVPVQMALIPVLRMYTGGVSLGGVPIIPALNLTGTFVGVWLAHTGFGIPFAVYLLRAYLAELPHELVEAARVDGASDWQILSRLMVPLATPALASFAVFQFLWVYNDLLIGLVFLGGDPNRAVVTQVLAGLAGSRGQAWHLLTAGAFVSILLPLAVFFGLQRYFVRGLTAGSLKG
jgi:alpha-glucoside transport system permease protein